MDYGHNNARLNIGCDRLSMLPDDLIHKILSYNNTKRVVQTSALSSRWRFLWTSMPCLDFSTDDFRNSPHKISEFVDCFLFFRNAQVDLYSVKICFYRHFNEALLKRILDYAFSHSVQQITVTCVLNYAVDFPLNLFRSPSLKYLRLCGCKLKIFYQCSIKLASTWELPSLTTLHLDYVAFHEDNLFSKCANLKNLTLTHFTVLGSYNYTLSHPQLSNLTIKDENWNENVVNVVAPQLENLSLESRDRKDRISVTAPNLASLLVRGSRLLHFSTDLPYLEKADICIFSEHTWSGRGTATLLQCLHSAKFLTFNLEFVKPLISYMERISLQPSPFSNLKGLKIYPVDVPLVDEAHKKVIMTSKVINYFLDGSPSATFTMISYEEIKEKQRKSQAISNAAEAQKLMVDLKVRLEKEKFIIETDKYRMTPMKSHGEIDNRKLKQIRIDQGKRDARYIISKLHVIKVLLLKDLPPSERDELQAYFSSLRAEFHTVVKKILHHTDDPSYRFN